MKKRDEDEKKTELRFLQIVMNESVFFCIYCRHIIITTRKIPQK